MLKLSYFYGGCGNRVPTFRRGYRLVLFSSQTRVLDPKCKIFKQLTLDVQEFYRLMLQMRMHFGLRTKTVLGCFPIEKVWEMKLRRGRKLRSATSCDVQEQDGSRI